MSEDEDQETIAQLLVRLEHASRGEIKRAASHLPSDDDTVMALIKFGTANGASFPTDAHDWSTKRLLRHALARGGNARLRSNPIARDESFVCAVCATVVASHGRTARNHCPQCLTSLHVDVVPGDREALCKGIMDPVSLEKNGETFYITHHCRRCAHTRRNRAMLDGTPPDSPSALRALSARGGA
jgi:hypothetical protein